MSSGAGKEVTPLDCPSNDDDMPSGYGAVSATDGLGTEQWRFLVCARCAAMIPNDTRMVTMHNKFHKLLSDELRRLQSAYVVQSHVIEEPPGP